MNIRYWLDRATKEIRFAPDRKAVREELQAHYEDRLEAGLAQGLAEYDAKKAAVAGMGDPDELAKELGCIHSPWWGYLWQVSRWSLVIAAVWLLFSFYGNREDILTPGYRTPEIPAQPGTSYTYTTAADTTRPVDVLAAWEPEGSVTLRGYRFSIPMAWVEHWTYTPTGEDPREVYRLMVYLKSSTWRLWERSSGDQWMILNHTVTDSNGRRYLRENEEPDNDLFCTTFQGSPTSIWYELYLELDAPDDIPAWLDIPVGYSGDVLHLDLLNEEVSIP